MGLKFKKRPKLSQIIPILIFVILFSLPVILIQKAIVQTNVFYGVKFPSGVISFADEVIAYKPIIFLNEDGLPNVNNPFNNPKTALGIPNSSHPKNPFLPINKRNDVSLGIGGSLTVQFKNNLLIGSGDPKIDLWVFEAGEHIESVFVEISKDGINWYNVGKITEQQQGIDIDKFGFTTDDFFSYVRLTDDASQGSHDGIWNEREWIGWGGADIDAVGAISSVSLTSTSSDFSFTSLPVVKWTLLMLATFGVGFSVIYAFKKFNNFKQ